MIVGLNYLTTPIEFRERFTFNEELLELALNRLKQTKSVLEAVIVSTCNRTEIYATVDQLHTGEHFIKKFIAEWFKIEKEEVLPFLYVKKDEEAIEYLFKVVTGLYSMVLGETQILGQVRQSFFIAQQYGATGVIFNTLFKQAITFAKKTHSETGIGENAVSISYIAVELAKKNLDQLSKKNVLIIGTGKIGKLAADHLYSNGVKDIMVINRTYEKAEELAKSLKGTAYGIEQLKEALFKADIVISSTGADSIIISKEQIKNIFNHRSNRPLLLIDIAFPRDIDPLIRNIEGVFLYDIDDLTGIVDSNLKEREKIAIQISNWIKKEVDEFYQWLNTLEVIPLIAALREKSLRIHDETIKSIENKLPYLTEKELKVIRKHTKSIVNQMLKSPIIRAKEMSAQPDAKEMMGYFKKIFDVEEEEKNIKLSI